MYAATTLEDGTTVYEIPLRSRKYPGLVALINVSDSDTR
jgi:hypothetical protein